MVTESGPLVLSVFHVTEGGRDACEELHSSGGVSGKAALVQKGTCSYWTQMLHVQQAGAHAMIVYDSRERDELLHMELPADAVGTPLATFFVSEADGQMLAGDADIEVELRIQPVTSTVSAEGLATVSVSIGNP
eukprot:1138048-Amphidinium_carterae.1